MRNNTTYYYLYDLTGNVIALVKGVTGNVVATYTYDAWGNCSVQNVGSETIGTVNPFRYKGYYYDQETGFYYLNDRYYACELGRLISADTTDVLDVQSDLYDKNLYAYCDNNPVMRMDSTGAIWHLAVGAVVGVSTQFAADISIGLMSGNSLRNIVKSLSPVDYVSAAVGGALAASGIGIAGSIVANAALGGTTYLANCEYNGVEANRTDFIISTTIGGFAGRIGGEGANGKNMRGVYSRAKNVINTSKSARKQAMYNAKITNIKKNIVKSSARTFGAGIISNFLNYIRKKITGSRA